MCFCLYMGSSSAPDTILFQAPARGVWLRTTNKHDNRVHEKFSLPWVVAVGSDRGCGCGFRNEDSQDGNATTQPNHTSLVAFLRSHFPAERFVELFACRWGEFGQVTQETHEIDLAQLEDPEFYFHDRGYYRVRL